MSASAGASAASSSAVSSALTVGATRGDGTVGENIAFGRADIGAVQIREALVDVGLWDEIMALPDGLEAPRS